MLVPLRDTSLYFSGVVAGPETWCRCWEAIIGYPTGEHHNIPKLLPDKGVLEGMLLGTLLGMSLRTCRLRNTIARNSARPARKRSAKPSVLDIYPSHEIAHEHAHGDVSAPAGPKRDQFYLFYNKYFSPEAPTGPWINNTDRPSDKTRHTAENLHDTIQVVPSLQCLPRTTGSLVEEYT